MKFTRLVVDNLGPYLGEHSIDLTVGDETPVILIHGENMRGKSSLFNAIRWALYGQAQGRRGSLATHRLISYDAIEARDFHMRVELEFDHDGHDYRLERQVQSPVPPTSEGDLTERLDLRRDGHFVPSERARDVLSEMLPPSVSRFFFFDGEMLNQYEVLLAEPSREAETVRTSIEQILGLPALENAAKEFETLRRDVERRQLRSVEAERRNQGLVAEARQVTEEIDALESDRGRLGALLEQVDAEKAQLSEKLQAFGEVQADVREAERLDSELLEAGAQRAGDVAVLRSIIHDSWWLPTHAVVRARLADLDGRITATSTAASTFERQRALSDAAQQSLERSRCELCGASLTLEMKQHAAKHVVASTEGSTVQELAELLAERRAFEAFLATAAVAQLIEVHQRYERAGLRVRQIERSLEQIRARLRTYNRAEIANAEVQYEKAVAQAEGIRRSTEDNQTRTTQLQQQLQRLQVEISRLPGADPRLTSEAAIFSVLHSTFADAIDLFRENVRLQVETEASEIFRTLTTEQDYARLSINDRYGLSILDRTGRTIRERSAGAEQIVALSLIGGLNRCAARLAPVVMDTPFGRLDVYHREHILKFVPTLGRQVILLVQSGELDRKRDMKHLVGKVAREYRIVRDGGPTRSRVEVIQEEATA